MKSIKYELADRIEWKNKEGMLHRLDGPALEFDNGSREWWVGGKRHRGDGPAIEWGDGHKEWYLNGRIHRVGGPAIINGKYKEWRFNGKIHRVDGPAIEWGNGDKEWWLNGKLFHSQEDWFEILTELEKLNYLFKMEAIK